MVLFIQIINNHAAGIIQKIMIFTYQKFLPASPEIPLLSQNNEKNPLQFVSHHSSLITFEISGEWFDLIGLNCDNDRQFKLEIPEFLCLPAPEVQLCLPAHEPLLQLCYPNQNFRTELQNDSFLQFLKIVALFSLKFHLRRIVFSGYYERQNCHKFFNLIPFGTIHKNNQTLIPNYNGGRSEYQLIINSKPSYTFQTCFILEPGVVRNEWFVFVLLQSIEDPSLYLGSDLIVQKSLTPQLSPNFLLKYFGSSSFLLRVADDIKQAATLFTPIERLYSSVDSRYVDLKLNTNEAYQYLSTASIPLQKMGFGIKVPSWWRTPESKIELRVELEQEKNFYISSGLFSVENLIHYDWDILLGKYKLSQGEFNQLVQLKLPLIPIRGQWAELNPAEIIDIVAFIKKYPKYPRNKNKQVLTGKDALIFGNRSKAIRFTSDGKISEILNLFTQPPKFNLIQTPSSLNAQLRAYQSQGVSWLNYMLEMGLGACLADDMGLGKTIQVLSYLLYQKEKGYKSILSAKNTDTENENHLKPIHSTNTNTSKKNTKKPIKKFLLSSNPNSSKIFVPTALIICPLSLVGTWQKEIERFAPNLKSFIHYGENRLPSKNLDSFLPNIDIVITTYQKAIKDRIPFSRVHWGHVIIDEAQNIKNPKTKQALSIKAIKAVQKIALTGTPIENHLSELWSIIDFLNPGYLGCLEDFQKLFALPIERYHDDEQAMYLNQLVKPFILRRLKTDKNIIQDLPPKQNSKIYIQLTPEQASLYEAVGQHMMKEIELADGIQRRGIILATLTKLKQICNHPMHFMHELNPNTLFNYSKSNEELEMMVERSGKMNRLIEMLQYILEKKEKAIIFTQYREMGAYLQYFLAKSLHQKVLFLSGTTAPDDRNSLVQEFQQPSGPQIFVLSLKAGGTGLTLTAANHVFHFDRWWNPAVEEQASDRAYRIGQTRMVMVNKFICQNTLEEKIDLLIDQKRDLADKILSATGSWITDLSLDQLRDLFCLRKDIFIMNSNIVGAQLQTESVTV
jgi:SNF2 family DNA or RNA helicase